MDQLEAMRVFVRVAELGNFSAVAKQLDVARSVVTRKVAALESQLGIRLMARSTRRLTLTSAGADYLEKSRTILDLVAAAQSDVNEGMQIPRGVIRISVPLSYGLKRLTPLLLDFADKYPEVGLEMNFSDRRMNLIEEGIDLTIRITSRPEPGDVNRRIAKEPMFVVAAPEYLAKHGTPRHPAELIRHVCLGYTAADRHTWQFRIGRKVEKFPVRSQLSANNGDVLVAAAARSLGITCQPGFIISEYVADGRLREILSDFQIPELGIFGVLPGNHHVPYRVKLLMDWLAQRIANDPSQSQCSA